MSTIVRSVSDSSEPILPTNHQPSAGVGHTSGSDLSLRQAALVAGLALLALAVLAAFANFGTLQKLLVPGDPKMTIQNIAAAPGLFRIAIGSLFMAAILDVIVAWALYLVFQPINRSLSLLAAVFRTVYATMFGIAVNNLFGALQLIGGGDFLKAFGPDQMQAQATVLLRDYQSGWDLALIIFGLHLVIVGILVFRSGSRFGVRALSVLVIAAGLGYLIDGGGKVLSPNYTMTVAMFTFVGEFLLIFWLLWKGIRGGDTKPVQAR